MKGEDTMNRLLHKLTALALIGTTAVATSAPAEASFVPKIAGTWEIAGTPDPGGCAPPPFIGLATIAVDGTLTTVDPQLGPGVGEAFRIGPKRYGTGFFTYLNPAPGVVLNVEVQGELEPIGDSQAAGRFRTILSDPGTGTVVCVYEGDLAASRLEPAAY
jgi:hypothetical protein